MYILTLSKSEFEILNECLKSVDDELYNRVKLLENVEPNGYMTHRALSDLGVHDSTIIYTSAEDGDIPMYAIEDKE